MTYSFCEAVTAEALSKWHIRLLTDTGRKLGGGADTPALCGRVVSWDIRTEVAPNTLEFACPTCKEIYMTKTST